MNNDITRRRFLQQSGRSAAGLFLAGTLPLRSATKEQQEDTLSHIFVAGNNGPVQNLKSVINSIGGIDSLIGTDDIVVIKTNAQQFNQGSANLAALKAFVDLVLAIPGFLGEVIICDNNHRWPPETKGAWTETFTINSDIPGVNNLMDLIDLYHNKGDDNVTFYCWRDSYDSSSKRVYGPQDGDGYVYLTDLVYSNDAANSADYRETMMTYPVFTSQYSGITIDLMHGAWMSGNYTDQPVKFIIFSGLCRHSNYAGVTSAIKNYFGVVDLSGGSNPATDGKIYQSYYNFHAFSYNKDDPGPVPGMLGGAVGTFLKHVRPADLHITTAEWVGWGDRTEPTMAENTGYICASVDPVALDYYCAKYILYPAAVKNNCPYQDYLNPDNNDLPFRQYLDVCHAQGVGNLDEALMVVHTPETPVNLAAFTVKLVDDKPMLQWVLASFDALYGFEVQRKKENREYIKIAFVTVDPGSREYNFYDKDLDYQGQVSYRLRIYEANGDFTYTDQISVFAHRNDQFTLHHNYPNPFNAHTVISYEIPCNGHIQMDIYNVNGKKVRNLLNKEEMAGHYHVTWDGLDDSGLPVATGAYFARTGFEDQIQSLFMLYIK